MRWEAIDDTTARLIVPFGKKEDTFTVTFDPQTGLIRAMEDTRADLFVTVFYGSDVQGVDQKPGFLAPW